MEQSQLKKAWQIGSVCIGTYVASYYIRNLLGVLTPSILSKGIYTEEALALFSSTYMLIYALGQLVNGLIGDVLKGKFMVSTGLFVAAIGMFVFATTLNPLVGVLSFGVIGFGLSMIRGPLVKVISENTLPKYARICCVFLSFSSFAGPLLAGLIAMAIEWKQVFIVSGLISLLMALFNFTLLSLFEKKGMILPPKSKVKHEREKGGILALFRLHNFVPYMVVGMVVEIAAASISFWMPTFFHQYLKVSEDTANMMFSAISLIRAICPFLCLYLFQLFQERDVLIVQIAFSVAAVLFLLMFMVKGIWISLIFFTLALMCSSVASSTLWSIYIPSLGKSGKVSSANGVLDCLGYAVTALVNMAIVPIIGNFGWNGVILFWSGVMLIGVIAALFGKAKA